MRRRLLGYFPLGTPLPAALPLDSQRSLAEIRQLWTTFLDQSLLARRLGIHVHIPFCRHRCSYCDCSSTTLKGGQDLWTHLEKLDAEMAYLAPAFRSTQFERLYVGGGTPNLLRPVQLRQLAESVNTRYALAAGAVRCIEFSPELSTPAKFAAAGEGGFNRVSFGVQSLNRRVLRAVNRPSMTAKKAQRAVALAQAHGFADVNVDLIFGLAGERTDSFLGTVLQVGAWTPHTITIQLLARNELSAPYRSPAHERAVARRFISFAEQLAQRAEADLPGYQLHCRPRTVVLVHESLERPYDQWPDFYAGLDRILCSTLGLGRFAHSKMHGAWHLQNVDQEPDFGPDAHRYVARRYSPELEAVIDAACALMQDGRFAPTEIARRYGSVPPALQARTAELVARGRLHKEGGWRVMRGLRTNPLQPLVSALAEAASDAREQPQSAEVEVEEPSGPGVTVEFVSQGEALYIRLEPASSERRYYTVVGDVGVFYSSPGPLEADTEAALDGLMQAVRRRLMAAGVSAGDLPRHGHRLVELVRRELARAGWSEAE